MYRKTKLKSLLKIMAIFTRAPLLTALIFAIAILHIFPIVVRSLKLQLGKFSASLQFF